MGGRQASIALVIIGAAGMVAGGLILAADDGDSAGERAVTTVATTSSTTAATSTTGAPVASEAVEEFYVAFADAIRAGDSVFLFDRLAPAVIERYGSDACLEYVARLTDPEFSVAVLEISEPESFAYETDGVSVTLDAITVRIRHTPGGAPAEVDAHVTIDGDGVRWLTDCGTPLAGK